MGDWRCKLTPRIPNIGTGWRGVIVSPSGLLYPQHTQTHTHTRYPLNRKLVAQSQFRLLEMRKSSPPAGIRTSGHQIYIYLTYSYGNMKFKYKIVKIRLVSFGFMVSVVKSNRYTNLLWFWPASSLICGNKMPTRCNRWFLLQQPANRTHNSQLHTIPTTWKPKHQIRQAATNCIILSSSWWWA